MTDDAISPEVRAAILARAQQIAAAAPLPSPEQVAFLRRWFAPQPRPLRRPDRAA